MVLHLFTSLALLFLALPYTHAAALAPRRELSSADDEISVAFVGNSILYFNDCPRLVELMLKESASFRSVVQDSCLRGAASLPSLWNVGNGMSRKFGRSPNARLSDGSRDIGAPTVEELLTERTWDFVVMNDYTQAPARTESRDKTVAALQDYYIPLLHDSVIILLQTAAYRKPNIKGSYDLGRVRRFTRLVREGYEYYAEMLAKHHSKRNGVRIAPVGDAYLWVHDNDFDLWEKLFYLDDFHPSPHGTWLEACVLYCTIMQEAPPTFDLQTWFDHARYTQPSDSMGPPNAQDAAQLREIACLVSGIPL